MSRNDPKIPRPAAALEVNSWPLAAPRADRPIVLLKLPDRACGKSKCVGEATILHAIAAGEARREH